MSEPLRIAVPVLGRAPEVRLLDARSAGLDESGLREWGRAVSRAAGAAHTSRSYRHPYGLVAWHDEQVGVDIERVESFESAFVASISTPAERAGPSVAPEDLDRHAASLWCAKEALAKSLGDALAYDPRRLESPSFWPDGCSGPWRTTPLVVVPEHLAWLCWRQGATRGRRPA